MLRSLDAVLLLALVAGASAHADTEQAQFVVRATVPARAAVEAVEQPTHLKVSAEDVARGYKDVSARYAVESNTVRGWLLRLSPRMGVTRHVEVRGLSQTVVLRGENVEIYQPQAPEPRDLELDYRFVLSPEVEPGSYELPVHVSATPL
jgi:hypothetical protein